MPDAIQISVNIAAAYLALSASALAAGGCIAMAARFSKHLHVRLSRIAGYSDDQINMEGF